jgi:hypothetical protein
MTMFGKLILFVVAVFCLSTAAIKPKTVEWTTGKDYNYGSVEFGSVHGTVFTFKNVGKDSILLQTVRTTCGCTAAKWPENPIPPGGTGDIKIEYSADRSGGFKKKIKVFFDAMRKPEILYIRGVAE